MGAVFGCSEVDALLYIGNKQMLLCSYAGKGGIMEKWGNRMLLYLDFSGKGIYCSCTDVPFVP